MVRKMMWKLTTPPAAMSYDRWTTTRQVKVRKGDKWVTITLRVTKDPIVYRWKIMVGRSNIEREKTLVNALRLFYEQVKLNTYKETYDDFKRTNPFNDEPSAFQEKRTLIFYRGTIPGSKKRIKTGLEEWDKYLFVADNIKSASAYGCQIEQIEFPMDTKILWEGTREFNRVVGNVNKREMMLEFLIRSTRAAEKAGYDGVAFKKQTDIGTAIFHPEKIVRKTIIKTC
jgi:hypothetical protein